MEHAVPGCSCAGFKLGNALENRNSQAVSSKFSLVTPQSSQEHLGNEATGKIPFFPAFSRDGHHPEPLQANSHIIIHKSSISRLKRSKSSWEKEKKQSQKLQELQISSPEGITRSSKPGIIQGWLPALDFVSSHITNLDMTPLYQQCWHSGFCAG